MNVRASLACSALSLVVLLACGDDSPSTGGGGAGSGGDPTTGGGGTGDGAGGVNIGGAENCTEIVVITQSGDGRTLFSTNGSGFAVEPNQLSDRQDVVVVSPLPTDVTPLIPNGTVQLEGEEGNVSSFLSVDAVDLLHDDFGAQDGRLFIATQGNVSITASPEYGTQFKGRVTGEIFEALYREMDFVDNDLVVIEPGRCAYLEHGTFDASDYVAACEAPETAPSNGECLDFINIGHDCNPVTNEGCEVGEICDWGGIFQCYPVEGDEVGLCEACDTQNGPKCQAGLTCDSDRDDGLCHRYCCEDADCGEGGECIAYSFAPYNMGVCLTR